MDCARPHGNAPSDMIRAEGAVARTALERTNRLTDTGARDDADADTKLAKASADGRAAARARQQKPRLWSPAG